MVNVYEPPNWRWLRAVEIVDENGRPSRKDEELIAQCVNFLRRKRTANKAKLKTLKEDYPTIFIANKLYEDEDEYRWQLESALCTTASTERVAREMGFGLEDVEMYATLFFDVRGKLFSLPFVSRHILRPAMNNRTNIGNSPDFIAKTVALTLGYDALMAFYRQTDDSPELARFEMLARSKKMRSLALEAAHVTPITPYTAQPFLEMTAEIEGKQDERSMQNQDAAVQAVKELMESVHFRRRTTDDVKGLTNEGFEDRELASPES